MARAQGLSPVLLGRWQRQALAEAVPSSADGLGAVQVLNGALTQRSFAFYVAHCLSLTLRRGDLLVLAFL